jgi:signal transduction histidine kinase
VGQVLTNLVQNACVHAFDGRDQGTITISARVDGDFVELRVQDDGSGMSEDNLKHAFDPFFTTRLGKGGSGLGLSVSYNIAHSVLAGSLSATSQPGHGSCMTLRFLKDVTDPAPDSENPMADH